jgi:hypothetical protein
MNRFIYLRSQKRQRMTVSLPTELWWNVCAMPPIGHRAPLWPASFHQRWKISSIIWNRKTADRFRHGFKI